MRTTVVLNDELAAAAKRLAAERRVSFSQILHDALRRELAETSATGEARPFSIPVFAPQDYRPTDNSPAEFDQLLHEDSGSGR